MRSSIIVFTLFALSIAAFGQVDTLMLVEDSSIEVSGTIDSIYVEDFTDSTRAIFITTEDHIYAYDSQSLGLIWTSPELVNPGDLQFGDINNDGYTDVAFSDSLNICLYDVINSAMIWTSPELESTYKCYTIGDRNNDDFLDVAIVHKEPFTRPAVNNNLDTVTVKIYNAPSYNNPETFITLLSNYYYPDLTNEVWHYEYPEQIAFNMITSNGQINPCILIYVQISSDFLIHGYHQFYRSGNCLIFDANDFDSLNTIPTGKLLATKRQSNEDSLYMCSLCSEVFSQETYPYDEAISEYRVTCHSVTEYNTNIYWELTLDDPTPIYWQYYLVNDINAESSGDELCFAVHDSISLHSFPNTDAIWSISSAVDTPFIRFIFKHPSFYEVSQIVYTNQDQDNVYYFRSSINGQETALLETSNSLFGSSDLNVDGNDEILSIDDNTLHIYHLDVAIGIDDPVSLPHSTFIKSNYPNPFNATTTIEYGLESEQNVTIEIYDILGRKVHTLVDETKPAGVYQASWNADEIPSGVYFYKINAGDYNKTKKMMLLK